ncbi:MAG: hypothetical protein KDD64_09320 [Bdellovibrionales bacterium]|nr:hypothetical protein [Bdellovibrionales bacterium]
MLKSLIVDNDKKSRMMLKQAVLGTGKFSDDGTEENLQGARERLTSGSAFDVIFVAEGFPREELEGFVSAVRKSKSTDEAACIVVGGSSQDEDHAYEEAILLGADGSLIRPFSVEKLEGVVELANTVKKNRWAAKEQIRIKRLLPEIMAKLDAAAEFRSEGFDGNQSLDAMKSACDQLNHEEIESVVMYLQQAIDGFSSADLPKDLLSGKDLYRGTSHRVRDRIERKVLTKIDERINQERESEEQSETPEDT